MSANLLYLKKKTDLVYGLLPAFHFIPDRVKSASSFDQSSFLGYIPLTDVSWMMS